MTTEQLNQLLADAGGLIEADEVIGFASQNFWTVQIDPATVLFADHDAAQNRLVLSGEVIAPADKASACELLLRYNNEWKTTGGVRMSLDSDDVVIQIGDVSTVDLDARKLAGTIQTFTGILRGWRDMLGRKATGTPDDAIDLAGQGFIRG